MEEPIARRKKSMAARMLGDKSRRYVEQNSSKNVLPIHNVDIHEDDAVSENDASPSPLVDFEEFPELCSMEKILQHHLAVQYFRLFMGQQLSLDVLFFWNKVERFRREVEYNFNHIYDTYISSTATEQVNIPSTSKIPIDNAKEAGMIMSSIFDAAQLEIFKLMKQNNYKEFLKSDFCRAFVTDKKRNAEMKIEEEEETDAQSRRSSAVPAPSFRNLDVGHTSSIRSRPNAVQPILTPVAENFDRTLPQQDPPKQASELIDHTG